MQSLLSSHLLIAFYSFCLFFYFLCWRTPDKQADTRLSSSVVLLTLFSVAFYASVFQNPDNNLQCLFFSTSLHVLKRKCFAPGPMSSKIAWIRDTCHSAVASVCVVEDQARVFGWRMNFKESRRQSRQWGSNQIEKSWRSVGLLALQNTFLLKSAVLWLLEELCYLQNYFKFGRHGY